MTDTHITDDHNHSSPIQELLNKYEQILSQHRIENPDLYHIVELKKLNAAMGNRSQIIAKTETCSITPNIENNSLFDQPLRGQALRAQIRESHSEIRQRVIAMDAEIVPRTQAHNRKSSYITIEEERDFRSEIVGSQIRAWRSLLPTLINKLSRIPDPRRSKSIKHKLVVLMLFGLFNFIFRLSSRREMNRELTGAMIHENLKKIFPDLETIPHADTLARLLERIDPQDIEATHINLIKELIKKKKFRKLLIHNCLPVSIDGTQKLYRDGLLQDPQWCERTVGNPEENNIQQYIYVIEAN